MRIPHISIERKNKGGTPHTTFVPRVGTPHITYNPRVGTSHTTFVPRVGTPHTTFVPRVGTPHIQLMDIWLDVLNGVGTPHKILQGGDTAHPNLEY